MIEHSISDKAVRICVHRGKSREEIGSPTLKAYPTSEVWPLDELGRGYRIMEPRWIGKTLTKKRIKSGIARKRNEMD